jgi:hypothetical protein
MQHRLVMEQHLRRFLRGVEIVHHDDEDKTNNDISNLRLFESNSAHLAWHKRNMPVHSQTVADALREMNENPDILLEDASRILGLSLPVLYKNMKEHGIQWKSRQAAPLTEESVREALQGRTTLEAAKLLGVTHQTLRNRFGHLLKKRVSPGFLDVHKAEIRNLARSQTLDEIAMKYDTNGTTVLSALRRWSKQDGSTVELEILSSRRLPNWKPQRKKSDTEST